MLVCPTSLRPWRCAICALAACLGAAACDVGSAAERGVPTSPFALVDLPAPDATGSVSLERALALRRSVRAFRRDPLDGTQVAQLMWSAQGVTASWGGKTAPSAGALYPLEIYAATPGGVQRYVSAGHRAELRSREDVRPMLVAAGGGASALVEAPAVFVISAVVDRTAAKYGDRAERYVLIEAGHAAQNLLLQAVTLDLGAVPIGAFSDAEVRAALALPADEDPLYLVPVGHPAP